MSGESPREIMFIFLCSDISLVLRTKYPYTKQFTWSPQGIPPSPVLVIILSCMYFWLFPWQPMLCSILLLFLYLESGYNMYSETIWPNYHKRSFCILHRPLADIMWRHSQFSGSQLEKCFVIKGLVRYMIIHLHITWPYLLNVHLHLINIIWQHLK